MRILANENIPLNCVLLLRSVGYDVKSITEGLAGISDLQVLNLAHTDSRVLITFDSDYGELVFLRRMPPPPAIIYFKFEPINPKVIFDAIEILLKDKNVALQGHFVTLEPGKVRSRPIYFG